MRKHRLFNTILLFVILVLLLAGCSQQPVETIATECEHSFSTIVVTPATALHDGLAQEICDKCGEATDVTISATKSIKIFAFGNSFTQDTVAHVWDLCRSAGVEEVIVANLYIGGSSLTNHTNNIESNAAAYTYYKNSTGTMETINDVTLEYGLLDEDWDIIAINGHSVEMARFEYFTKKLDEVVTYVQDNKTNPNAKIYYNATWADEYGCTRPDFAVFDYDQAKMSETLRENSSKINDPRLAGLIPTGTAIQNVRTSRIGDHLTRDGYHLNTLGRYIVGLTLASTVLDVPLDSFTWTAPGVSGETLEIAKEAVSNAQNAPFDVTQSTFVDAESNSTESKDAEAGEDASSAEPEDTGDKKTFEFSTDAYSNVIGRWIADVGGGSYDSAETVGARIESAGDAFDGNVIAMETKSGVDYNLMFWMGDHGNSQDTGLTVENSKLALWVYVSDADMIYESGWTEIDVGSAGWIGSDWAYWNLQQVFWQEGWNYVELDFSTALIEGNFDMSALRWIRFCVVGVPDGEEFRIGGIKFIEK